MENASYTNGYVRNGSLRISRSETDQWLFIDCSVFDLHKSNYIPPNDIPPYYHLKFTVPKGLKIVLSDEKRYLVNNLSGYRKNAT